MNYHKKKSPYNAGRKERSAQPDNIAPAYDQLNHAPFMEH